MLMAASETVEKLPPDSERTWAARGKRLGKGAFRVPPFYAWQMGWRFITSFWAEKSRIPFSDFLIGVPLCERRVFSCKSSGQVDPM